MNAHELLPSWLQNSEKAIAIVGFGREGKSSYRFLRHSFPNRTLVIYDEHMDDSSNEVLAHDPNVRVFDQSFASLQILEPIVIKTPGIPKKKLRLTYPAVRVTSQIDIFAQMFGKQMIAVTGTKGKSTTSHVVAHVLSTCGKHVVFAGNIGKPLFEVIDSVGPDTIVVVETSAFQSESLTAAPHIGVLLNLYQDHLDYYDSMNEYVSSKLHMFLLMTEQQICMHNLDDQTVTSVLSKIRATKQTFSLSSTVHADAYVSNNALWYKDEKIIDASKLQLPGEHNRRNCLPAILCGKYFGCSNDAIAQGLATVKPLQGRLERIGVVNEVSFYDDAVATIPEATIAALESLGNVTTLIAGGHERHQNFEELGKYISTSTVQNLILFPTTGKRIAQAVEKYRNVHVVFVSSMQEAVTQAYKATNSGGVVLLSTASPSFGLFADYADRSRQYTHEIEQLTTSQSPY